MPDNLIRNFIIGGGSCILLLLIYVAYQNTVIEATCLHCDVHTTLDKDSTHVIKFCIQPYDKEDHGD